MTVQAGRVGGFKVCATTGGTYYTPNGVTSIKPGDGWKGPTMVDTTQINDTAARMVSTGFFNSTLTVTMLRDAADTNGQGVLLTQIAAGSTIWVQYSEDNSSFKKCEMAASIDEQHQAGASALSMTVTFTPAGGTSPVAV
jgi:hypothetical protein